MKLSASAESFAFCDELFEQRRRFEAVAHRRFEFLQFAEHFIKTDQLAVEHRAATINRPAIAVDPDDIDVGSALRLAFFKDLGAFVNHRIDTAFENLIIRYRTT